MSYPASINGYTLYTTTPNTIDKGALYTKEIEIDVPNPDKKRLVRVYLPSTYEFDNPNNRYAVIYMMDGKNLFDHHTSFVGEWQVDESIEDFISKGKKGLIVVGIDSAKSDEDRMMEMLIESENIDKDFVEVDNGYGSIIAQYIFDVLKDDIDSTFFTIGDKEHTAVGGSSMGGLYSFYMGCKYKERVSFALCFSPAFACYKELGYINALKSSIISNEHLPKFMFFIGNNELENVLEPLTVATYRHLESIGCDKHNVRYIFDSSLGHNEYAWRVYFPIAIDYWGILN